VSPLELIAVGAVGATGLALVGLGVFRARRRRAAEARRQDDPAARQVRVDFEEDPIVAALGVGSESARRRRER
jgi:hypothetical protein